MEVIIEQIRDQNQIMCDIKSSNNDSIKDYLYKNVYDVNSGLINFGFLPEEVDDVIIIEQYVEKVGNNLRLK